MFRVREVLHDLVVDGLEMVCMKLLFQRVFVVQYLVFEVPDGDGYDRVRV